MSNHFTHSENTLVDSPLSNDKPIIAFKDKSGIGGLDTNVL